LWVRTGSFFETAALLDARGQRAFTRRDAYRVFSHSIDQIEDIDPTLDLLVDHGWIRPVAVPHAGPGRKPSPTYEVHPSKVLTE
jgi:hypothetical protein